MLALFLKALSINARTLENPANIRIDLILPETRVIVLHFRCR